MYESPTDIIKRVGEHLHTVLPAKKPDLIHQLVELEACRFDLAQKTVEWHTLLANKKRQILHPKDKDLTELDRNVMLEANISVIRQDYDFLVKLEELVKDRIELGKILLTLLQDTI